MAEVVDKDRYIAGLESALKNAESMRDMAMESWKDRGVQLNALYDVLAKHVKDPTENPVADLERLLERESGAGLPRMALRPCHDDPELMDDIVVKDVEMFRAEQMDTDNFWVCCYLTNGERITWHVVAKCRPRRIEWFEVEGTPYIDIDAPQEGEA